MTSFKNNLKNHKKSSVITMKYNFEHLYKSIKHKKFK